MRPPFQTYLVDGAISLRDGCVKNFGGNRTEPLLPLPGLRKEMRQRDRLLNPLNLERAGRHDVG